MSTRARAPRVLLITEAADPRGIAEPVLEALSTCTSPLPDLHVQLRAKSSATRDVVRDGRTIVERVRELDATLLVNGRVDVALAIDADGVHLPERGVSASDVRSLMPNAIVSRACHDARGLSRAADEGADYAVLSPVFEVPGKGAPLGIDGLSTLVDGARIPVVALGGITFETVSDVTRSGAHGIAVIRLVLSNTSPARALARLLEPTRTSLR